MCVSLRTNPNKIIALDRFEVEHIWGTKIIINNDDLNRNITVYTGALNFSVYQALKIVEVLTRHEKSATCIPKLVLMVDYN